MTGSCIFRKRRPDVRVIMGMIISLFMGGTGITALGERDDLTTVHLRVTHKLPIKMVKNVPSSSSDVLPLTATNLEKFNNQCAIKYTATKEEAYWDYFASLRGYPPPKNPPSPHPQPSSKKVALEQPVHEDEEADDERDSVSEPEVYEKKTEEGDE